MHAKFLLMIALLAIAAQEAMAQTGFKRIAEAEVYNMSRACICVMAIGARYKGPLNCAQPGYKAKSSFEETDATIKDIRLTASPSCADRRPDNTTIVPFDLAKVVPRPQIFTYLPIFVEGSMPNVSARFFDDK